MTTNPTPEPKRPFVLHATPVPFQFLLAFTLLAALVVGLVHLLTPVTFVKCSRPSEASAWSCEVRGFRFPSPEPIHRTYDLVAANAQPGSAKLPPVALTPIDGGGGALTAGDLELARFSLREVPAASAAARELASELAKDGAREHIVIVRQSPSDDLFLFATLPVLGLFALWLFFRPSRFVVDPQDGVLEVELRSTPFTRTRFTASLAQIEGVSGRDREIAISLADGTVHHVAPVGWTDRGSAQRAHALRAAIEAATA